MSRIRKRIRRQSVHCSMTVEMSFLMPMILFLLMGCIMAIFYYHDKNILSGAAYETGVVGSTKAREKDGVEAEELETLFSRRVRNKCILFPYPQVAVNVEEKEIEIVVSAARKWMKVSVVKRAAVTEPERYIRDMKRLDKVIQTDEK